MYKNEKGQEVFIINDIFSYLKNSFIYGEIGDRLATNKDNEYYQSSLNTIVNFIPTELGTLKIAKKNQELIREELTDVQQTIRTKFSFNIILTKNSIYLIDKTNHNILGFVNDIDFDGSLHQAIVLENFLLVPQKDGTRIDFEINSSGQILVNSFFREAIRKPIKDRSVIKVDIYQVRNYTLNNVDKKRPYKISTTELQEFSIDSGKLKFKYDTELNITRIYYPFQTDLSVVEDIPEIAENDYIISIYPIETSQNLNFYLGNAKLTLTGEKSDKSGKFYESVNIEGAVGETGLITYGEIFENFENEFNIFTEYQNRLVVSDGKYIYFSKVGDYNYFLNGTNSDDSFFIKLSTVNSEEVVIYRIISGRGIWVITNLGIFLLGYSQVIQGSSLEVNFIGSDECSANAVVINNTLYYINNNKEIKACQNTTSLQGYVDFSIFTVDKFNPKKTALFISEIEIENKKFLYVETENVTTKSRTGENYIFLYLENNVNIFSRTTLISPANLKPLYKELYGNGKIFIPTKNNVANAYVVLNPPPTQSKNYGTLLNDTRSQYKGIAIKLIDDTYNSIDSLEILRDNERLISSNSLGEQSQGVYNIYDLKLGGVNLTSKVSISINTLENENDFELQAIEVLYNIGKM